jgi:hypothetical protein
MGVACMIRLQLKPITSVADAQAMLQTAIGVEFGTLPPYLYALYSIMLETNPAASANLKAIAQQEMIHFCLACNILNALGGNPVIAPPTYPGPLPGDIGHDGKRLIINVLPFSQAAMFQGMQIERPINAQEFPVVTATGPGDGEMAVTIGEFYLALDAYLATLPASAWTANRHQISDNQFFVGQLFPVNNYADAHRAIAEIISEGEGSDLGANPLDWQEDYAHYYRFGEIYYDKVLTKTDTAPGYNWGPDSLGVDWTQAYNAISNPSQYDFSKTSTAAQAAQVNCNACFTAMVNALQSAVSGNSSALGQAVRAMFDLRMAALHAFTVPLDDGSGQVAGPAFSLVQS